MFKKIISIVIIALVFSCSNPVSTEIENIEKANTTSRGNDTFSIVLFPDPQKYTKAEIVYNNPDLASIYSEQTKWIRDNKDNPEYKIKHVIVLGDITEDNKTYQWEIADKAFKVLDDANIPYSLSTGNHDYKSKVYLRDSEFSKYFGRNHSRFRGKSWRGGSFSSEGINNYNYLTAGGVNFLILNLEFNPRKKVLTWADYVIAKNPTHKIIVNTHNYLREGGINDKLKKDPVLRYGKFADGGRVGDYNSCDYWGDKYHIIGTSQKYLFKEFISRHSNIFMTVNGHIATTAYREFVGTNGNKIHSILSDFQSEGLRKSTNSDYDLGNGWIQLVHITPSTGKIEIKTVNVLSQNKTLSDKVFGEGNDPSTTTKQNYAIINEVFYGDTLKNNKTNTRKIIPDNRSYFKNFNDIEQDYLFKDFSICNNSKGNQLYPKVTVNKKNGKFKTLWADDNNNDNVYNLMSQLFYKDGNVVNTENGLSTDVILRSSIYTDSSRKLTPKSYEIDMNDNGDYVITWEQGYDIYALGTKFKPPIRPIRVNNVTKGVQSDPDVAIDSNGNFVVTWEDDNDGNGTYQVYARVFDYSGRPTDYKPSFTVNGKSKGNQLSPVIEMFDNGDYIIAYEDDTGKNGKNEDIYIKGYQKRSSIIKYNDTKEIRYAKKGHLRNIAIAVQSGNSDTNSFSVVWEDDIDNNGYYEICGIYGEVTLSNWKVKLDSVITINTESAGNQLRPDVAMNDKGQWVVVWEDDYDKNGKWEIFYQSMNRSSKEKLITDQYSINSKGKQEKITTDQIVNRDSTGNQIRPSVAIDNSGYITVVWEDDMDENGKKQVLARNLLYGKYTY